MTQQTNKKKKIFGLKRPLFILCCIFSFILLVFLITWSVGKTTNNVYSTYHNSQNKLNTSTGTVQYTEGDDEHLPQLTKVNNKGEIVDDFKVAVLGDLHLDARSSFTIEVLERMIKQDKPDLVVLNGDINWRGEYNNAARLNEMFERNNQYWTFTLGNHDGEWLNNDKQSDRRKVFNSYCGITEEHPLPSTHCLARTRTTNLETCGSGNNCINIVGKDNKILHSLFFADCECFRKENQDFVNWYNSTLSLTGDAKSTLFTHIPFVEFKFANNNLNDKDVKHIYGCNMESINTYDNNCGIFDEIVKSGKTESVVFSHDHVNNTSLTYKGIRMTYSLGLSFNSYTRRNGSAKAFWNNVYYMLDDSLCNYIEGATDIYINGAEYEIGNVYAQFNGIYSGIENELYRYTFAITYGNWLTIFNRVVLPLLAAGCVVYWILFGIYYSKRNENKSKTKKKD